MVRNLLLAKMFFLCVYHGPTFALKCRGAMSPIAPAWLDFFCKYVWKFGPLFEAHWWGETVSLHVGRRRFLYIVIRNPILNLITVDLITRRNETNVYIRLGQDLPHKKNYWGISIFSQHVARLAQTIDSLFGTKCVKVHFVHDESGSEHISYKILFLTGTADF